MAAKKTTKKATPDKEEAIKKVLEAVEKETAEIKEDVEEIKEGLEKGVVASDGNVSEENEKEDVEESEELEDEVDVDDSDTEKSNKEDIEEENEKVQGDEEGLKDEEKVPEFGPVNYEKNQNSLLWKFIYVVAFLVGVGGAIIIYQRFDIGSNRQETAQDITPTEASTPTPTPLDYSDYPITIHNGAGIAGAAAAGQELLESEGFEVIDTGNADNYDYTETVIYAGSDVPEAVIDALRKALETEYAVAATIEEYETDNEILVIIGSEAN